MMISKDKYKRQLKEWLCFYREEIEFVSDNMEFTAEKIDPLDRLSKNFDRLVDVIKDRSFSMLSLSAVNVVQAAYDCYLTKKPGTTVEEFFAPCEDVLLRKNADYAGPTDPYRNFRRCQQYNIPLETGIIVRMCDKISRIENLLHPDVIEQVKDEKVTDTLIDLVNYTAILCTWLENTYRQDLFWS